MFIETMTSGHDQNAWVRFIVDFQLRHMIETQISSGNRDELMRAAFVYLEQRIRESAGLASHHFGKELIDAAFHPETGQLQPVSPVGGERAGLHQLLLGIFLFYRNPIAHRPVYHSEQASRQIFQLIDHALELVRQSAERTLDLRNYVSPHEGEIRSRRDYRVDIDGDGEEDLVVLVELGPSADHGELRPHLAPIILKKRANGYTRIPADWVSGISMYGPVMVELRHITDHQQPDILIAWAWGETMTLYLVLRHDSGRYVLLERENTPNLQEPYSGPNRNAFTTHHAYKSVTLADVDGDGLDEVIQTLRFDEEELVQMGYVVTANKNDGRLALCRVWRWDPQKQVLVQDEERLIVESYSMGS